MTILRGLCVASLLLVPMAPAIAAEAVTPPAATTAQAVVLDAFGEALKARIARLPAADNEPLKKDYAGLTDVYTARKFAPFWLDKGRFNPRAKSVLEAFAASADFALDPKDFAAPAEPSADAKPDVLAAAELEFTLAALTYARYARGGRISDPAAQLSTQLDRRPQWIDPREILSGLATAPHAGGYLASLQPKHVQFAKLRELYVAELGKKGKLTDKAKRIRANMEMWRWMPDDMGLKGGPIYVLNNIPEFMQYVYKDGQIIRKERIVAGMLDKQSAIFSRPLKHVVLRPTWKMPESILVNELWPSLKRNGSYMGKYGLELLTKEGEPVNWRKIDWSSTDIREYRAIQPPGRKNVLGHVKFSFPSQHTIFMHDTPDKYMFKASRRTLSHGCLRVQNPMALAELILKEDKGWDKDKVAELDKTGPLNNEIEMEKRIPIHLTYFTLWVDEDGSLKSYADIYGHEKRVRQALDGKWDQIDHGYDHLAPVEVKAGRSELMASVEGIAGDAVAAPAKGKKKAKKEADFGDFLGDLFGL